MLKKPTSKKVKPSQRTIYMQRTDNEGFEVPNGEIYKLACCDCGLVHQIVIIAHGLKKGTPLGMAAKRDNRATAARRARLTKAAKGEQP